MLLPSKQGTWLISRVLATPVFASSNIALTEVIARYADHQWRFSDFTGSAVADNNFRIHRISDEFVRRFGTTEPVREIRVIGHADRVWRQGGGADVRDEDDISQRRANEVFTALMKDIIMNPAGRFTGRQLQEVFESGDVRRSHVLTYPALSTYSSKTRDIA